MPVDRSRSETAGAAVRERIASAARDLFAERGYEQTTVEAIAERAGVGRRTFFRYFRAKDDVIFPDHELISAEVLDHFARAQTPSPVRVVCEGARIVFLSYVQDAAVSVQRYSLTRSAGALRDREIASISQYTRLFSRYLRAPTAGEPLPGLQADVVAAAVVAVHNNVLRQWLRAGGGQDPLPGLDAAFDWLVSVAEPAVAGSEASRPARRG